MSRDAEFTFASPVSEFVTDLKENVQRIRFVQFEIVEYCWLQLDWTEVFDIACMFIICTVNVK